jgi:hypothetical protein
MADKDRDRYCTPLPIGRLMHRQFRGWADLDPCFDPTGLTLARQGYDIRQGQNGLVLPWRGKVWLNPPYSNPAPWLERASLLWRRGLAETVAIVNVQSGAKYWRRWVWGGGAQAVCFLEGRVAFLYDGIPENGNRHDQAVIYYGPHLAHFRRVWGRQGAVVRPPRPLLTGRSLRSNLARMDTLHDDENEVGEPDLSLLQMLGPAIGFTVYSRIKHMTIEEVVNAALPIVEDFINGYQYGQAGPDPDDPTDEDGVTFDVPEGANGRDPDPPPAPAATRKRKKKAKKKAAKKKSAKKAGKKKKATRKAAAAPAATAPAAGHTQTTKQLDEHVLSLLKAKATWTPSRDLKSLVRGVNDNQLRKSLARLVAAGQAVSEGATKSKVYMAAA